MDYNMDIYAPMGIGYAILTWMVILAAFPIDIYILVYLDKKTGIWLNEAEKNQEIDTFFYKNMIAPGIILVMSMIMLFLSLFVVKKHPNETNYGITIFLLIIMIECIFLVLFYNQKKYVYDFKKLSVILHIICKILVGILSNIAPIAALQS